MKTLFSIGHYSINVFGVFIAIGILVGYLVANKEAKRRKFDEDVFLNLIIVTIISGIVGARLYYVVAFNLDYYLSNPIKIFAFRDGGLSIQGALIGGIIAALLYSKIRKFNLWKAADIMAPGIILGQAIGRIGCDVFGVEMTKNYFWGVNINGNLLHPAQIYEFILDYILFGFIWSRRKSIKYDGQLFFTYLIGFSINRFIIEFFRENPMVLEPLSVAHVTSIAIILVALICMHFLRKRSSLDIENNALSTNEEKTSVIKIALTVILLIMISIFIYYKLIWG